MQSIPVCLCTKGRSRSHQLRPRVAHAQKAGVFLAGKRLTGGLAGSTTARSRPRLGRSDEGMGKVRDALGRREEDRPYYATALQLALTKQPRVSALAGAQPKKPAAERRQCTKRDP